MSNLADANRKAREGFDAFPVGAVALAAVSGFVLGGFLARRFGGKPMGYDKHFTGHYPRFTGAISAVTGGPPEDMNAMPVCPDPKIEASIYDGTQL